MGGYQLHKNEWSVALVCLLILASFRINGTIRIERTKAKIEDDTGIYKNAHQVELVKEWVTSQYCKTDLEILCPDEILSSSCYGAFDPPLRFAMDLSTEEKKSTTKNCSMRELIDHTKWTDKKDANDLKDNELLTYFVAHILDQVRTKSSEYFRAEDRSIQEFEQSRLIESTLTSMIHLFSSPTQLSNEGQTLATTATEYGISHRVWTREEIISSMHEAVLWHTHHKRHGSSVSGAALRLSRQQPSFVFKYLPLVKEQIQFLEVDDGLETRYRKLYPFPKLISEAITLDSDRPQSDRCLWSHYEEGSLISQDCMLALETAPLKIRELDWEGNYFMMLIHIYTCFSGAFALWMLGRIRKRQDARKRIIISPEMDVQPISGRSLGSVSSRSTKAVSSRSLISVEGDDEGEERKSDQIRRVKWICVGYLGFSLLLATASSAGSETIQFSDFLDGMCLVLLGFLWLRPAVLTSCRTNVDEKRRALLSDPTQNRHYKKWASSVDFDSC